MGGASEGKRIGFGSERDLFVDSKGVRLAVRDYGGTGRPLVLVHGGPGPNLVAWDGCARQMIGSFHSVAFDQRGHGQSDDADDFSYAALAGDVRAVVERLSLDRPVVVGHSWGGWIALQYAALDPACAGVVAVDGIVTGDFRPLPVEQMEQMAEEIRADPLLLRAAAFAGTPEEVDQFVAQLAKMARRAGQPFSAAAARRDYVAGSDGLLHLRFDADRLVALHLSVAEQEPPSIEVYEQIRCPVLLVLATRGRYRREVVEGVQARFPRLQVRWINCGHDIPDERPAELAALLAAFVDSR